MRTENALRGTFPMKSETVGAVIMASGLARRFGSNKLLADFGGEPMLCRVLRATEGISPLIVVTRSEDVHRLCVSLGVPVLLHTLPHRSDTVRLGLDALLREMPSLCGCLFAPGDQPLLRRETVDGLCGAFLETPEKERTIYRLARKEAGAPAVPGSPVLFGRAYFDALLHLPEGKGGGVVVRRHPESVHLFAAAHPAETEDADTPEALERLLSIYFTLGV